MFYADGPHWTWLVDHGVVGRLGRPSVRDARIGFRVDGDLRAIPPRRFLSMLSLRRMTLTPKRAAPVDRDFHGWASERFGEETARHAANAIAVATYEADTGRLSAAFVWDLITRVFAPKPPAVRWVVGGWQSVVDRLVAVAKERGVDIVLGSRVTELPTTPTIVATELSSARVLLGDDTLRWHSGHAALLDIAVPRARTDRFVAFDLDEGGFHENYAAQDDTVAPAGESLFQLQMPVRAAERKADAAHRLELLADHTVPGWRERARWHRTATAKGRTGALDLPGQTWRDRPAIDRGGDVALAGDMVAAPGMRGEISINSALRAVTTLLGEADEAETAGAPEPRRTRNDGIYSAVSAIRVAVLAVRDAVSAPWGGSLLAPRAEPRRSLLDTRTLRRHAHRAAAAEAAVPRAFVHPRAAPRCQLASRALLPTMRIGAQQLPRQRHRGHRVHIGHRRPRRHTQQETGFHLVQVSHPGQRPLIQQRHAQFSRRVRRQVLRRATGMLVRPLGVQQIRPQMAHPAMFVRHRQQRHIMHPHTDHLGRPRRQRHAHLMARRAPPRPAAHHPPLTVHPQMAVQAQHIPGAAASAPNRKNRCLPTVRTSRNVRPRTSAVANAGSRKSLRVITAPANARSTTRPVRKTVSPSGTATPNRAARAAPDPHPGCGADPHGSTAGSSPTPC
ncbi:hypothetical protein BJF85_03720 [Saccharomonospora sp. CUA-673]|nr:hypothetical protein BJF85_03720 [Saccharomonospora sp. CUA-673]